VTLEEDSGLFGSIPPEEGSALAPSNVSVASGRAADLADGEGGASSEGAPSSDAELGFFGEEQAISNDEDLGLFGDAGSSSDATGDASEAAEESAETPSKASYSKGVRRAPSARKRAKAERARNHAPARLAAAVGKLRKLEDTILAHVVAADQLVRRLESRGVHADAGYPSRADFECRILAATPLLKGLRESLAAGEAKRARAPGGGGRAAVRTRKTKALKSMAGALARMRELDVTVQRAALNARDVFAAIEAERLYEECGYLSFEEFLERALGPSPVLAAAVALAEFEPPLTPEEEPSEEAPAPDAFASILEGAPGRGADFMDEAPAETTPQSKETRAPAAPVAPPAKGPKGAFSLTHLVVTLSLCLAATFGGGAAGSWSVLRALAHLEPAAPAANAKEHAPEGAAESAPPAGAKAHPAAPAGATPGHGPKEKAEREPQAKKAVPGPLDPLAIPVLLPHARTTGPREARR
jgi:hypothetical protein